MIDDRAKRSVMKTYRDAESTECKYPELHVSVIFKASIRDFCRLIIIPDA